MWGSSRGLRLKFPVGIAVLDEAAVRRTALIGILFVAVGVAQGNSAAQQSSDNGRVAAVSTHQALIDRYCITCHNQKLKTAGLMLDQTRLATIGENAPVWEKVLRKLKANAMPPAGAPRPDKVN